MRARLTLPWTRAPSAANWSVNPRCSAVVSRSWRQGWRGHSTRLLTRCCQQRWAPVVKCRNSWRLLCAQVPRRQSQFPTGGPHCLPRERTRGDGSHPSAGGSHQPSQWRVHQVPWPRHRGPCYMGINCRVCPRPPRPAATSCQWHGDGVAGRHVPWPAGARIQMGIKSLPSFCTLIWRRSM